MELTPIEFFLALSDQEQLELSKIRPLCEAIRLSTLCLLNVQIKRQIKNPQKLWMFPWDKNIQREPQTAEQMKNVMRAIAVDTKRRKRKRKSRQKNE